MRLRQPSRPCGRANTDKLYAPSSCPLPSSVRARLERGFHGFQLGIDLFRGPELVDFILKAGDPKCLATSLCKVSLAFQELELGEGLRSAAAVHHLASLG